MGYMSKMNLLHNNSKSVDVLLAAIKIQGGQLVENIADKLFELSFPIPGKNNAKIAVQRSYNVQLSTQDIMEALYDVHHILDAVDIPKLYEQ